MKGSKQIADILKNEYGVKNLKAYEEIDWKITEFSDTVSRVKITSRTGASFCCPVYAMFDGSHVAFYGNCGDWLLNCTWDANVHNLKYNSPYYQLEKLEYSKQKEFSSEKCVSELLKLVREGPWYADLTEEQVEAFEEIIKDYTCILSGEILYEYEDIVEEIASLIYAANENEFEWYLAVSKVDNEIIDTVFGCEYYELYDIGNKPPVRIFIILYMLSVVANTEKEAKNNGDD